jgi:hypothetical protein
LAGVYGRCSRYGATIWEWFGAAASRNFASEKPLEEMMIRFVLALLLPSFTIRAIAGPTCHDKAADKKLAIAALTSFVKKCESDAKSACDAQAADKKLSGAAKTTFTNKCVKDATGT